MEYGTMPARHQPEDRGEPVSRVATRALLMVAALTCSMSLGLEWNLSLGVPAHLISRLGHLSLSLPG